MEEQDQEEQLLQAFFNYAKGALWQFRAFRAERGDSLCYVFDCPEYDELRKTYRLEEIAGQGDDFSRARNLLSHFAPRMAHDPMYDNHIPCNALALLAYCYEQPEHGINCLNKAKVFVECCLALGIFARRVSIMPFSPYDMDNHVVAEIWDGSRRKWVMMDPTTCGMFVDENGTPLSLLEMRERFASNGFATFIPANVEPGAIDLGALEREHLEDNWYICKNLFSFAVEKHQGFGVRNDDRLHFIPKGFSLRESMAANCRFRMAAFGNDYPEWKALLESRLAEIEAQPEPEATDIRALTEPPQIDGE